MKKPRVLPGLFILPGQKWAFSKTRAKCEPCDREDGGEGGDGGEVGDGGGGGDGGEGGDGFIDEKITGNRPTEQQTEMLSYRDIEMH